MSGKNISSPAQVNGPNHWTRNLNRYVVAAAVVAAGILAQQHARADCYPSELRLNETTVTGCTAPVITYVLNENADGTPGVTIKVKKTSDNSIVRTVTFTGTAETQMGTHSYAWDKKDDSANPAPDLTSYYFEITTNASGHTSVPWFQISNDTVAGNQYASPRGVAVNHNRSSPNYGRIYVTNTTAGVTKGMFIRNADSTDSPVAQGANARTGGVTWNSSSSSPLRLTIGPDDQLYITDWSNANGGLWVADPDVTTASLLLSSIGGGAAFQTAVNGAISAVNVSGTLAGGNLKVYTMDQDHGGSPKFQSVWRYDIGAGPLPWNNQPNQEISNYQYSIPYTTVPGTYVSNGTGSMPDPNGGAGTVAGGWIGNVEGVGVGDDMDIAPDGKIFVVEDRATQSTACSGLLVFSPDNGTGQSTLLYDSLYDSRNNILSPPNNVGSEILFGVVAIAVSPDNKKLAVLTLTQVIMVPLFQSGPNQGLPDLANRTTAVGTFVANGRDVCWDAVGNLYVVASGTARLRIYSPPTGPNTNTTASASFTLDGVGTGGPTFNPQPQNQSVCLNSTATFTSSASGSGTITYQWYHNAVLIAGETNPSLTVTADGVNALSGDSYYVSACDVNGVTVSNTVTLTIYAPPTITLQPFNAAGNVGASATMTADGTSGAPGSVTYQWYKLITRGQDPANPVPGANSPTLTLNNLALTDAGDYYLRVTDTCGGLINSRAANLGVLIPACNGPFADADGDGDVDMDDFGAFQACYTGDSTAGFDTVRCRCFDRGGTPGAVDVADLGLFLACFSGPDVPADPSCGGSSVLYAQDFDVDDTANWTVNKATDTYANDAGNIAEFFYDYSLLGIPPAPNSVGGTTRGLRLRANAIAGTVPAGSLTALSVSPTGLTLPGDYTLEFDLWINFNGPLATGNTGSSQITEFGIATAGITTQVPGNFGGTIDSVYFASTGEGVNGADYRVYDKAHAASWQDGELVYAAGATSGGFGDRNAKHPYYTQWFGGSVENNQAPAGQIGLPAPAAGNQTGTTGPGAQGFRWRHVRIVKNNTTALWYVDNHLLATVDMTQSGVLGGTNILFGQSDVNNTTVPADQNDLVFGLIDNVRVTRN